MAKKKRSNAEAVAQLQTAAVLAKASLRHMYRASRLLTNEAVADAVRRVRLGFLRDINWLEDRAKDATEG